jgi:hypothetical protein
MNRPIKLFVAGLCLVPAAATAQHPTSTSDRITPPYRIRGDAARSDVVFRRTVACAAERQPGRARTLVDTQAGSYAEARVVWSYQSLLDWCFSGIEGGVGFASELLRGGMAEIFYQRAFPSGLPREAPADGAAAAAWSRPRQAERGPYAQRMELLHASARCIVLRNPAAVSAMLAAAPFTAPEMAAMRTLQPDISACLDSGIAFTATRQSLRALLAEAALHYGEAFRTGFAASATRPSAR